MRLSQDTTEELEKMGLWDISVEDFDAIDEEYEFSERYKRKKRCILAGLKAVSQGEKKTALKGIYRAAAVILAALVLIPGTAYAAAKLYKVSIDNTEHRVDVKIDFGNTDAADLTTGEIYIPGTDRTTIIDNRASLKVELTYVPEGCVYYEDYRYWGENDNEFYGISMWMQVANNAISLSSSILYSVDSEMRRAGGYQYVVITKDETFSYNKEVFVPLEHWNVVLRMYVGRDIDIVELDKIIAGVVVEETDNPADFIPVYWDTELNLADEMETVSPVEIFENDLYQIGDVVKVGNLEISVTDMVVEDSIQGYDREKFYSDVMQEFNYINADGSFQTYERRKVMFGDGTHTVSSFADTELIKKKFVYLTIKLKNTGKMNLLDYNPNFMKDVFLIKKENGTIERDQITFYNEKNNLANFTEPVYFDNGIEGAYDEKIDIASGEEYIIHLGFLVDEDMLKELYMEVPYGINSSGSRAYYIKLEK